MGAPMGVEHFRDCQCTCRRSFCLSDDEPEAFRPRDRSRRGGADELEAARKSGKLATLKTASFIPPRLCANSKVLAAPAAQAPAALARAPVTDTPARQGRQQLALPILGLPLIFDGLP